MSRRFISQAAAGLIVAALSAAAGTPVEPVNKNSTGLALKGYDPVAYFKEGKATKGQPRFSVNWMGATWLFDSQDHRDLFESNPEQYAPQFGGYCSWAVGHGYTADADPEAWKIVDGKLYVNYNKSILKKWEPDAMKLIDEGTRNWPSLHR